jgi:hypothetical protein
MRHDISVATYVVYTDHDHFGGGYGIRKVDVRDPQQDVRYALSITTMFMYYDVLTAYVPVGRRRIETKSGHINGSRWYVIDGQVLDANALRVQPGDHSVTVQYLEMTGRNAIRLRNGWIDLYYPEHMRLISSR